MLLSRNQITNRFPNNDQLLEVILTKNIYEQRSKNKIFLLENLENYNNPYKFSSDIWDNLTIEHIMPQKITQQWKDQLGVNWQIIHPKYLHTLGNLTLTLNTKNSQMGNRSFEEKQAIDFDTSKLKLTRDIGNSNFWNEETIVARAKQFANEITQIWQYPKTDIQTYNKLENGWIDLDEDFEPTYTRIINLQIEDKIQPVRSWSQVLVNVCEYAFEYSSIDFLEYMTKEINNTEKVNFSNSKDKLRAPKLLQLETDQEYYVETNKSADRIIKTIFNICRDLNTNWDIKVEVQ